MADAGDSKSPGGNPVRVRLSPRALKLLGWLTTRQTWLRTLLAGLFGAVVASLYPATSIVCPAWTIQVVDTAGNPLRGAFVRQVWKDYSVESASHEQDTQTDGDHHVSFLVRTFRSYWLARTIVVVST